MLCTRCHHDIHRQGWEILVRNGRVDFIPPPTIDPMRRPRPGGLAAITIDDIDGTDGTEGTEGTEGTDPPHHDAGENSVPNHAGVDGTRENSARHHAGSDATGENSARHPAAWVGYPPPEHPGSDSAWDNAA